MIEETIKNNFIGISNENGNLYINTLDLNNNKKKILIEEFLLNKEIEKNKILIKDRYIAFCLDCNKNIKDSKCDSHLVKYFKDINKNINIKEIEKTFKNIFENYNNFINILEQKIKYLKKRNEEQKLLVEKIINIYNSSLKDNNLTFQILLNVQNFLKFNEMEDIDIIKQSFNLEYNILKEFKIDNYIEENILIEKIQKNMKLDLKEEINSLLVLEKINKIIFYSKKKIYLFNLKNYSYENQISEDYIFSLNLMKNKETILVSQFQKIRKLKIENNKIILEDYLCNINIYGLGKIIDYKNGIAWTGYQSIYFSPDNKIKI